MCRFVVTEFVKTCDELALCPIGRPGLFVKSQCLSFSIVTRIEYYVSKLKKKIKIQYDMKITKCGKVQLDQRDQRLLGKPRWGS